MDRGRVDLTVHERCSHLLRDPAKVALDRSVHAFLRWLRKTGVAMAARMPMMTITTRSSIRVNPSSPSFMDLRMRASMASSLTIELT